MSSGVVLLIAVNEDAEEGQELSFDVHRFSASEEISQIAWGKDTGLLLNVDGRGFLFKWDLLNSPELVQMESLPSFLPVQNSKKVDRRLVLSESGYEFVIWWPGGGSDVFPWNPKPEQRANVLVYSISSDAERPNLIFYKKTDSNLLSVQFSPAGSDLITVEDFNASDSSGIAEVRITKYNIDSTLRTSEVVIPLQNQLKCHAFDRLREKICLGLCNASIIISFQEGKITRSTKSAFVPCHVAWHENSMSMLVLGTIGQVQMFDLALNPLFFKDETERFNPTLTIQLEPHVGIYHVSWGESDLSNKSYVLLGFDSGNISVFHLYTGPMLLADLVSRHLDASPPAFTEAIKLLGSVPWDSDQCRTAFHIIFSRLRVEEYAEIIEQYFDDLFDTYFDPVIQPFESVWIAHKERMAIRAISYHHWLFLAGKFRRSLEIAAKINDEGCIRKVLSGSIRNGMMDLAADAERILKDRQSPNECYVAENSNKGSSSENSWCSTCESSESESEFTREKPKTVEGLSKAKGHSQVFESGALRLRTVSEPQGQDTARNEPEETGSSGGITVVRLGDV